VEQVQPARYTVLGWTVDDIADAISALGERGVRFERYDGMEQSEDGVWTSPGGARIAWFKDPDGNTLSLTQSP
jgi:predicted enzyme related to lactoylglutathione lyase